ncbi:MAG: isoaspartyl peptidase/L-asparaginase, partial [Planctomycetes bacterium]|nr:isoaspartyl peptidase/L-asparaginase [Planctomycetota bacterium]
MHTDSDTATRRRFLAGAATSLAAWQLGNSADANAEEDNPAVKEKNRPAAAPQTAAAKLPAPGRFPVVAVSSHNGREATRLAYDMMMAGKDTLDACVAGVTIVENDPDDHSVGYGGLPNEDGVVELDAAVMHGPTHQAGAVAALRSVKNPAQVAQLVLQQTDHVLLVAEGALRFARAQGFKEENLLTETARKIWLYWKQTHSG